MKTVCIKYGIGEGDYHGKAFVAALKDAGFGITRNDRQADIIITHSGGCFFLPPVNHRQLYILINPPYWPRKSLVWSTVQKITIDFMDYVRDGKILPWMKKTLINLAHIVRYLIKTLTITLHAHKQRFYEALHEDSTIIIRSTRDTFLSPKADTLLKEKAGRTFRMYTVPGQHDSCWRDPKPYIDIIRENNK